MKDKKDQILATALQLFATQGLNVPTARIAKDAGVANGTLFNYFPTKQDLIDALYVSLKGELALLFVKVEKLAEAGPETMLRTLWHNYVRWAIANPQKHQTIKLFKTSSAVSASIVERLENAYPQLQSMCQKGVLEGVMANFDPFYFQSLITAMIDVCIEHSVRGKLRGPALEKQIEMGFSMFWKAIS